MVGAGWLTAVSLLCRPSRSVEVVAVIQGNKVEVALSAPIDLWSIEQATAGRTGAATATAPSPIGIIRWLAGIQGNWARCPWQIRSVGLGAGGAAALQVATDSGTGAFVRTVTTTREGPPNNRQRCGPG